MSKWIKKDDQVLVVAGNDKGKVGKVLQRDKDFVVVQGVNMRKKHLKKSQKSQMAQIVEMEMPIHISNVAHCTKDGTKIKPRVKVKPDGGRDLIFFENEKENLLRTIKP